MLCKKPRLVLMLDVESDGLHGEAFAVGAVLARLMPYGVEIVSTFGGFAELERVSNDWVRKNVLPSLDTRRPGSKLREFSSRRELRDAFWAFWLKAKDEGAELWADVAWPVETNFLSTCVADGKGSRDWEGPYPLYDLGTLLHPDVSRAKFTGLSYTHNPVTDATASVHALWKVLFVPESEWWR